MGGNIFKGNSIFETAETYSWDLKLFHKLGLKTFHIDITKNKKDYYIGKVKFENGSYVKIWVYCCPAQFWHFEVYDNDGKRFYKVRTGSGSLSDYWPSVDLIARNMFVVEKIKG